MTLTPQTIRADGLLGNKKLNCGPGSKPCGGACIPKDHKCRASWNKPVKIARNVAVLTGAAVVGTALFHPREKMRNAARNTLEPVLQAGYALGNTARGNFSGATVNVANIGLTAKNLGGNARTLAEGYGTDIRNIYNRGKEAVFKMRHHRPAAKRDSIYATGFTAP